jgi:hypothetical protein
MHSGEEMNLREAMLQDYLAADSMCSNLMVGFGLEVQTSSLLKRHQKVKQYSRVKVGFWLQREKEA